MCVCVFHVRVMVIHMYCSLEIEIEIENTNRLPMLFYSMIMMIIMMMHSSIHGLPDVNHYETFFDEEWRGGMMETLERHYYVPLSESDRNLFRNMQPVMELIQAKVVTDRQECTNQIGKQSMRFKKIAMDPESVFGDVVQSICRMRGDCMPVLSKAMLRFLDENRMIKSQMDAYIQPLGISIETVLTFFPYTYIEMCREIRAKKF